MTGLSRLLPDAVVDRLRCPRCSSKVAQQEAALVCPQDHRLDSSRGYLDLSGSDGDLDQSTKRTYESFGFEWTTFSDPRPEDEEHWRRYFADVDLTELGGRVGLDAGCGQGRYSRFTAHHLAALVALDGSDAAAVAARNLADLDDVVVVKADLRRAPLAEASFGFVSCLGVLHHLSDPEEGFRALARLLDVDGILVVYLYSRAQGASVRAIGLRVATVLRRLTVRLPHPLLRALSAPLALALYGSVVVPGRVGVRLGWRGLAGLPLNAYRGLPVHALWLDTFDRLSAPVEHRYTWEEVAPWCERAGMSVEAVREDFGLTIVARRTG